MTPEDLKYYKEHEWVRVENGIATVGITDYAQDALGDIVYLDLPDIDEEVMAGDIVGEIESVKSTADLHTPVSGKVIEINKNAIDNPEIINEQPYGDGWLFKIELSDPDEINSLMDAKAYDEYVEEL
ncbi:MAG: glycine cleavage system protein GcvH [Firmicutes bacterium]|nr:glycine cleavage system protein GcvH [Bacillota bacterium]